MAKIVQYRDKMKPHPGEGPEDLPKAAMFEGMKSAAAQRGRDIARAGSVGMAIGGKLMDAAIARKKAEIVNLTASTEIEIETDLQTGYEELRRTELDPVKFNEKANKLFSSTTEKYMKGKPDAVRKNLTLPNEQRKLSFASKVSADGLRKEVDRFNAQDGLMQNHLTNRALTDLQSGEMDSLDANVRLYTLKTLRAQDAGLVSQTDAQKRIEGFSANLRMNAFRQTAQLSPTEISENFDAVAKNIGLTEEQKIVARKIATSGASSERSKYNAVIQNEFGAIVQTGAEAPGLRDTISRVYPPAEAADHYKRLDRAAEVYQQILSYDEMSNEEIQAAFSARNPRTKADYSDLDLEANTAEGMAIQGIFKERLNDPFSYAQKDIQMDKDYPAFLDAVIAKQEMLGMPQSVISNDEASEVVGKFKQGMTADDRITTMLDVSDKYGRHTEQALREMHKKGLPIEAVLMATDTVTDRGKKALSISVDMTDKDLTARFKDDPKRRTKIIEDATRRFTEGYGKTIPPDQSVYYNELLNAYVKTSQIFHLEGKDPRPDEMAMKELFGKYEIIDTLRIPRGVSKNRVTSHATKVQRTVIRDEVEKGNIQIPLIYQQPGLSKIWLDGIRSSGEWYTLPNDSGMVLMDNDGNPVLTSDGELYTIPFATIMPEPEQPQRFVPTIGVSK